MAWPGHWALGRDEGAGSAVSILVPQGQAVGGNEPAGAGEKGQLLHKALLEQKPQPAARGQGPDWPPSMLSGPAAQPPLRARFYPPRFEPIQRSLWGVRSPPVLSLSQNRCISVNRSISTELVGARTSLSSLILNPLFPNIHS